MARNEGAKNILTFLIVFFTPDQFGNNDCAFSLSKNLLTLRFLTKRCEKKSVVILKNFFSPRSLSRRAASNPCGTLLQIINRTDMENKTDRRTFDAL